MGEHGLTELDRYLREGDSEQKLLLSRQQAQEISDEIARLTTLVGAASKGQSFYEMTRNAKNRVELPIDDNA